jgi:putative ABC transport system permease protein
MVQDIRYGLRALIARPGFTLVVVLTLALGIGANAAIFSVVNAVLFRPLPFPQPDQLVVVHDDLSGRHANDVGLSVDELRDFQERSGVFDQISAVWPVDANLTGSDRPERIELLCVSPNYFSLLGAAPQLGRVFNSTDVAPGFADAIVLSDAAWHRLFAADPHVLGRHVRVDTDSYTIVGVMPPGFRHPGQTLRNDVDMWATAGFAANPFGAPVRAARILPGAIGRLKAGLSVDQAQRSLDAFVRTLRGQYPNDYPDAAGWSVSLIPAQELLVGRVRTMLIVLLAAVALVLTIGCVNIANLLLARSSARQREMAIRLAIGASRARLIRQLLTESLLLAAVGGALALVTLSWVMRLLVGLMPADIPRAQEIGFSGGVFIFAAVVTFVTGALFGLVPAWQSSRPELVAGVKDGTGGAGTSARHHRFRNGLVVTEFALCLVLMIGAGLLLRSFGRLIDVDPGFDPNHVLLARIWLPVPNNPAVDPYRLPEARAQFAQDVIRRTAALPGVKFAAMSDGAGVPLIRPHGARSYTIEDQTTADNNLVRIETSAVSPDFFRALDTPLVRGRFFTDGDDRAGAPVAIIDQAAANRYWPNIDPIGRRIKVGGRGSPSPWMTVAGVVKTIKMDGLDLPSQPHVYLSLLQNPGYALAIFARAEGDPAPLAQPVLQQVQAVNHDLPVFGEEAMTTLVRDSLAQRVFVVRLVGLFGVLALLLAGVGIYGTMAYSVTQRTREIGIRIALGASQRSILVWVVARGLRLTMMGIAIGGACAVALTRLLRGMLFEVAPTDPATYFGLAAVLAAVALLACYLPARRATRIDPMVAASK